MHREGLYFLTFVWLVLSFQGGERIYQCLSRPQEASCYFFYLNHSSYSPGVNELLPEGSRPPSRIVFSAAWPNVFLLLRHLQGFSEWNFLKIIVKCEPPIQQYLQNCLLSSSQALKEALSASKEILDWWHSIDVCSFRTELNPQQRVEQLTRHFSLAKNFS